MPPLPHHLWTEKQTDKHKDTYRLNEWKEVHLWAAYGNHRTVIYALSNYWTFGHPLSNHWTVGHPLSTHRTIALHNCYLTIGHTLPNYWTIGHTLQCSAVQCSALFNHWTAEYAI